MTAFTSYDNTTGEILFTGEVLNVQAQVLNSSMEVISEICPNVETYYVANLASPSIVPKLLNTSAIDKVSVLADGVDKITLSGTPIGAIITLGTLTLTSDGTDIDLIFDIPGTYPLKVDLFPYLPFEAEINAT